ncbi:collagen alpha-1(III) chain-like [Vidua macroura]|uniref:collagen alpha-1(III) chain-like n=1 Tax=Vidua macroura TaxID=187451 RepID=UPI0023A8A09F|nr:collagen alpha-1(III) chain-like [Vidua macroura]
MKGEGGRNKSLHGGAAKQRRLREKAETLVEEQGERQPCCLSASSPSAGPSPHTIAPQRGKGEGTAPLRVGAARGRAGGGRQSPGARKGGGVAKQPGSLRGKGEQRRHLQTGASVAPMPPAASGRGGRGIHDVRGPREARRGRPGSAGPPTATPSGSARYWAGPGQGRRDGLRYPRPLPRPGRSPAGGAGARGCQGCRSAPPSRALSFSAAAAAAAAAGTAAPLVSLVPLRRRCLQLASATFGSPSPYASSATRIEASSPSCQIVSRLHRAVQNTGPGPALLPRAAPPAAAAQAHCAAPTAAGAGQPRPPRCGRERGLRGRGGARRVPDVPQVTLEPSVCTEDHRAISECPVLGGAHKDRGVQLSALHGTSPGVAQCA